MPNGIVDDLPVRPMREHVGADEPAQRHEGDAFFRRLERGMDRRAGRVLDGDAACRRRRREARRRSEFAEAHRRRLDRRDAAGADQQIGLQARGRQRDQVQPPDAAPDQRPRRRHGHARDVARHRQHAAVGDGGEGFVEGANDHVWSHITDRATSSVGLPLPACGERVGVRGTLRGVQCAESPPHPAPKEAPTSPRKRGEVGARGAVTGAIAPAATTAPASPGRARTARGGCARRSRRRSRWRSRPTAAASTARRRRSARRSAG